MDIKLLVKNAGNRTELSQLIDKYLIPQELEKKTNAEVSTPYKLRQDMLNKIPEDFWTNIRKVFEPCVGKGGFLIDILDRFMTGLKDKILDEDTRYKTIVEQCLYWSDINPTNIFICKLLLDPDNKYKLNYNEGDTLKLDIQDKFGFNKFDAVIGNPPYNSSGNVNTGNTIWQHFTKISLNNWLNNYGYLLFVHPPGWRKPNTEKGKFYGLYKLMTKNNQMLHLSIHGVKDGMSTFKCGTRYDWYLIEKTKKYKDTTVIDENKNELTINLTNYKWLPNYNIDFLNKIIAVPGDDTCNIIYSRNDYGADKKWMSKVQTDGYKYPCIQSTNKSGIVYKYSSVNNRGHFGISKIIFGFTGINDVIIDMEGKYGMTQHAMAIGVSDVDEATEIKTVLLSKKFKLFLNSCLFSQYIIDWNIFKDLKKDFYKEFI